MRSGGGDAVLAGTVGSDRTKNGSDQESRLEVGEDLADIVAAGAEDGEERVANRALERTARQPPVASM